MLFFTLSIVFMTRSSKFRSSLRSVSPVSPTQAELDAALDVLNNSLDSRLLTDVIGSRFETGHEDATVRMSDPSPTLVHEDSFEKDSSVIIKCQTLIDELQTELDAQRARNEELECEIARTRADFETFKASSTPPESIKTLESEIVSLKQQLMESQEIANKKDVELENMTRHCERRLEEMKRQMKQYSMQSTVATPPIPSIGSGDQEELKQLRMKLKGTEKRLTSQSDEMKSVVDSYERQLRALKDQLEESQDFFRSYYAVKAKSVETASSQRSNPFRDY